MQPPLIFIGMHRSGTSMLVRLLENSGLFAGTRKDRNNEAIFFKQLNFWLMAQCGGRWDAPDPVHYLLKNKELLTWAEKYLRKMLHSPRAIHFLGLRQYITGRGINGINIPWGWKDPRNTFTLPLWLRIFPEARVLYIERHGVDAAHSLFVREKKLFSQTTSEFQKYQFITPYRPKKGGFYGSPRCSSLEGGFSLWMEYIDQAQQVLADLPDHRVLKLQYEHFLEKPVSCLQQCAEFCGLDISIENIEKISADVDSSRAYAYRKNPVLLEFAQIHRKELQLRGYTSPP
ncbi:MAG: sulfotransferase [Deltaproteobacteria bacterium]|nr:sulfotransferase [Deltaproteobacteria bacterium]